MNKALSIDPRNVEGLVARGALYANSGSFKKAIVDFEAALKLNGSHANAKKYLGETLLALGRNFEEENKFEESRKAYIDCLKINPHHQEALASLEYLKTKLNAKKIVEPAELELPRESKGFPKDFMKIIFVPSSSTQHRIAGAAEGLEEFPRFSGRFQEGEEVEEG